MGHLTGYSAPTGPITFSNWHWCSFSSNTTTAYINTLFNYFEDIGKSTEEDLNQSFIEVRRMFTICKSYTRNLVSKGQPTFLTSSHLEYKD